MLSMYDVLFFHLFSHHSTINGFMLRSCLTRVCESCMLTILKWRRVSLCLKVFHQKRDNVYVQAKFR